MRQLTEEETRNLFAKLALFLGENLKYLIDREDEDHVFRLQDQKIYYMSKSVLDIAQLVGRDELVSAGVYVGNYTKAGKVKLYITALPLLAKYAKYKVWVKPGGEQVYLYGNNVLKCLLGSELLPGLLSSHSKSSLMMWWFLIKLIWEST
jgi:60S ribosome subunit biogenesis protein NIP7